MKVIFLDIDGVLNHTGCKEKLKSGCYFVAEYKMALLKKLVEETGAKIVLSSSWRIGWFDLENGIRSHNANDFIALREKFAEYGLEFLGYTPFKSVKGRGEEIDLWLRAWEGEPVESFVILDDMNGRYLRPYAGRLVRTSFTTGLLPKHVELAKKILEKPVAVEKRLDVQ